MAQTYTDKELIAFRQYHYKRGFKIGVAIILVMLFLAGIIVMQLYVNANI